MWINFENRAYLENHIKFSFILNEFFKIWLEIGHWQKMDTTNRFIINKIGLQCNRRFVDKPRFVDRFLVHEKSKNQVRGGFQKQNWEMKNLLPFTRFVDGFLGNEKSTNRRMHCITVAPFLISNTDSAGVNWNKHQHYYCGPPKVKKTQKTSHGYRKLGPKINILINNKWTKKIRM